MINYVVGGHSMLVRLILIVMIALLSWSCSSSSGLGADPDSNDDSGGNGNGTNLSISGTVRFERYLPTSNGLNYAGSSFEPARQIAVYILSESGEQLGATLTDDTGFYQISNIEGGRSVEIMCARSLVSYQHQLPKSLIITMMVCNILW